LLYLPDRHEDEVGHDMEALSSILKVEVRVASAGADRKPLVDHIRLMKRPCIRELYGVTGVQDSDDGL